MPIQATNTNNEISYRTASFIGSVPATISTFNGFIGSTIAITGSIAGTVLTVSFSALNIVGNGMIINGTGIAFNTIITSQASGTAGGIGTYNISISQTIASGNYLIITTASTVLTVNSASSNPIQIGMILTGTGVSGNTTITGFGSGSGGVGTYNVSVSQLKSAFITATGTTGSQLNVVSVSLGPIQVGMILTGNGTNMNSVPIITSQLSGPVGGIGTYILSAPFLIATGTQFTGTLVIPVPLQELQAVIYSTLLPDCDSPIGYVTDNLIGGTESSSTSANIIYHFLHEKPIMGNFSFTLKDYTGDTLPFDLTAIVFIDFRNVRRI
jgi:hypothetical protein